LAASTAAALVLLMVGVNTSPVFAEALSKVPGVNSIVKVLTFKEYTVKEKQFKDNIKCPGRTDINKQKAQEEANKKLFTKIEGVV